MLLHVLGTQKSFRIAFVLLLPCLYCHLADSFLPTNTGTFVPVIQMEIKGLTIYSKTKLKIIAETISCDFLYNRASPIFLPNFHPLKGVAWRFSQEPGSVLGWASPKPTVEQMKINFPSALPQSSPQLSLVLFLWWWSFGGGGVGSSFFQAPSVNSRCNNCAELTPNCCAKSLFPRALAF